MKKLNKFTPLLLTLFVLAGCTKTPNLEKDNKKNTIVDDTEITQKTYQQLFDNFYQTNGIEVATNELLLKVAKEVLNASSRWGSEKVNAALTERINEKFDEFYGQAQYKKDGLFQELKLVQSLRNSQYDIQPRDGATPFEESMDAMIGYGHLLGHLTFDYSDYIEKVEKDFYLDLLKEEYILDQRVPTNSAYFTNKKVRKVQYFSYTPSDAATANKFAEEFQEKVDAGIAAGKDLKEIVTEAGGIEEMWKTKRLEELAKDFALINEKADKGNAVNDEEEYPLPACFKEAVKAAELKYTSDEKYGFKDIYNKEEQFDADEINEVKSKMNSYSNNGAHSRYQGYYEKQLEIINSHNLEETITTTDGTDLISSTVQDKIENFDKLYGEKPAGKEGNFIDVYDTKTCVFKVGETYYIVYAEKITDESSDELKKEAARSLATVSSNVKNAIYYYLTSLTEKGLFEVNNQDIYNYLNETYNYGEDA